MGRRMSWEQCLKQGIVIKTRPNPKRASKMLRMAHLRMRFWDRPIGEEFAALKVEAYYDIIKEHIHAHLYKNGYNCTNHLCLISYLRERFPQFKRETAKIDELRKVRNDMNYKGLIIEKEYLKQNEPRFKHISNQLKERLKN